MMNGLAKKVFEHALSVNSENERKFVAELKQRYPQLSSRELAKKLIERSRWWGAGFGMITGFPANPWISVPAAVTDSAAMLRVEVVLACRIGLIYDPHFLDGAEPPYEILVPIFGINAAGQMARELGVKGGMGLTRAAVRTYINKGSLTSFKAIMLKYFGIKVTQNGVLRKTVPVVGGIIGGAWNFGELTVVGARVIDYFEDQPVASERAAA